MHTERLATTKIAVYGTLRKGENNHHILEDSEFLGFWRILGSLYTHGGFPGLVGPRYLKEVGYSTVLVEVYRISDKILSRLDALEGVPHHYERATARLCMDGPNGQWEGGSVLTYKYKMDVSKLQRIEGGDWVKWRKSRET